MAEATIASLDPQIGRSSVVSLYRIVESFSRQCYRCQNPGELFGIIEAAARELGFSRVALVHGAWFRQPSNTLIRMDNFGEWAELFVERRYYLDDPSLLACQRANAAFSWTRLDQLIPIRPRHLAILREAERHGLKNGFTLPVGVVGEPSGCCSFATNTGGLPSRWHCRAAGVIGTEAFSAARRIHGYPARRRNVPHLSPRKLECLRWLSCGKTDGEIAIILGLKEPTIRTYMALLRQDFGVVSRCQLVAEALRFGLISYDDAIPSS